MSSDLLDRLLAGTLRDPDGSGMLRVATRKVVVAPSLAGTEADCVEGLDLGRRLAVVSDPTTHASVGARVERALAGRAMVQPVRLPEHPHADEDMARRIEAEIGDADAVVAVGSGTINDLCKFASARLGRPYVVYATAPS